MPLSFEALGAALSASEGLGIVLGLVVGAPLGGFFLAWALARLTAAPDDFLTEERASSSMA